MTGSPRTAGGFDLAEYVATAGGSLRDDVAADVAAAERGDDDARLLSAPARDLTRALSRLEHATLGRMRRLLVTATHKDARMTAFLATWAFEKFWFADALDALLEADGHAPASTAPRGRTRGPILNAIVGSIAGSDIVAAHATTGLVDEIVRAELYAAWARQVPQFPKVAQHIIGRQARHVDFFRAEAPARLADSDRGVRLARRALASGRWPVGGESLTDVELAAVRRTLADRREVLTLALTRSFAEFDSIADFGELAPSIAAAASGRASSTRGTLA